MLFMQFDSIQTGCLLSTITRGVQPNRWGGYRGVVSEPARGCVLDSRSVSVLLYVVYGMQVVVCTLECFVSIAASRYYVRYSVARLS